MTNYHMDIFLERIRESRGDREALEEVIEDIFEEGAEFGRTGEEWRREQEDEDE